MNATDQSITQTDTYEATTKRLHNINVSGTDITYAYQPGSNQIASITIGDVTTNYTQQSNDKALLSAMSVTADGTEVYSGTYTYNKLDERTADVSIFPTFVNDDGSTTPMKVEDGDEYVVQPIRRRCPDEQRNDHSRPRHRLVQHHPQVELFL